MLSRQQKNALVRRLNDPAKVKNILTNFYDGELKHRRQQKAKRRLKIAQIVIISLIIGLTVLLFV
jgi:Na+/H+ antiporter NhaB